MRTLLTLASLILAASASASDSKRRAPLQVYILAGQSNMQGHANVSTLPSMAQDPKTADMLKEIVDSSGKPKVFNKIWISSVGSAGDGWSDVIEETGNLTVGWGASHHEIGPELEFGITMQKKVRQPILIIKTAWGGRSLLTDFRPPSGGPRVFSDYLLSRWKERKIDPEKEEAKITSETGVFYRHMIDHIKKVLNDIKRVDPDYDPAQGYRLAGFVWFQGFNDMIDDWAYHDRNKTGSYGEYSDLMADLIRDVRKDLSAPKLPVVIGVMGIGGDKEGRQPAPSNFRAAQAAPAALPEFKGNVTAVQTSPFWDDELDALQQRMERLNGQLDQAAKRNKLTGPEREAARTKAISEAFTPAELEKMKGISNGGYHYLGAAKILEPIGKAFAEALWKLQHTAK